MAYSLASIPPSLLPSDQKERFIAWLASLPAPTDAKRSLVAAWRRANHAEFTPTDYAAAGIIDTA